MVYIKTYIFNHFYKQYLVLLTMVPRNSTVVCGAVPSSAGRRFSAGLVGCRIPLPAL